MAKRTMSLNPAPWVWLIWAEHCLEIPWNFYPSPLIWEWEWAGVPAISVEALGLYWKTLHYYTQVDSTTGLGNQGLLA